MGGHKTSRNDLVFGFQAQARKGNSRRCREPDGHDKVGGEREGFFAFSATVTNPGRSQIVRDVDSRYRSLGRDDSFQPRLRPTGVPNAVSPSGRQGAPDEVESVASQVLMLVVDVR